MNIMHKKVVFAVFIVTVAVLAVIFLQNRYLATPEEKITASRVVIPQVTGHEGEDANHIDDNEYFDPDIVSLVPLNTDEVLLATVNADFDGDKQDDQVNAIKKEGDPFISLIVGLFNVQKGEYERVATIATPIRQMKTFSYMGMDLTGDHRTAIVYQGIVDTGHSVLQAFFINKSNTGVSVMQIANLESDGSIVVDQTERSDAYNMMVTNDASYNISVYSSDPENGGQIHSIYSWDEELQQYKLSTQDKISDTVVAASDRAKLPSGSADSYFSFLNGLWYKTSGSPKDLKYLYFDQENNQIMYMQSDQYEVYEWTHSSLRSQGIFIFATNDEIKNFQRQMDVAIRSTDEIRVRVFDNVLFLIAEGLDWNGDYKKMSDATSYIRNMSQNTPVAENLIGVLEAENEWRAADGSTLTFENGAYTCNGELIKDEGTYAQLNHDGLPYIQFRSSTETPFFKKIYLIMYAPTSNGGKNKDSLVLQPYVLTPDQSYPSEDHIIILSKKVSDEQ
jgi:hypothetical protein